MRTLTILFISAAMICSIHAQDFRASLVSPAPTPASRGGEPISKPAPVGMAETIDKYGWDALNPWAPSYMGKGVLASNIADAEGNYEAEEKNKQYGGIVIFGYMF